MRVTHLHSLYTRRQAASKRYTAVFPQLNLTADFTEQRLETIG